MKRLSFVFLLSLTLAVLGLQVVPCFKAASSHKCCQQSSVSFVSPSPSCCTKGQDTSVAAAVNQTVSFDFFLAAPILLANHFKLVVEEFVQPISFHWPGSNKAPIYLTIQNLLL